MVMTSSKKVLLIDGGGVGHVAELMETATRVVMMLWCTSNFVDEVEGRTEANESTPASEDGGATEETMR